MLGQTTLLYAQKGYRGRAKPVNRKNRLHKLRKFLQPAAKHQKSCSPRSSRSKIPAVPHLHVIPAPPLSRFVELLWYYEEPLKPHAKERLMPDGCVSLIINLAENQTRIYDAGDLSKMRTFSACSVSGRPAKCATAPIGGFSRVRRHWRRPRVSP